MAYPAIVSYQWSFGDGETSSLQNPTHAYTKGGTYVVSLTVTNSVGDIVTKTIPVKVEGNNIVSATWNLGDGRTGTGATYTHHYLTGIYHPSVTMQDYFGSSFSISVGSITVGAPNITANPTIGQAPLLVNFSV